MTTNKIKKALLVLGLGLGFTEGLSTSAYGVTYDKCLDLQSRCHANVSSACLSVIACCWKFNIRP